MEFPIAHKTNQVLADVIRCFQIFVSHAIITVKKKKTTKVWGVYTKAQSSFDVLISFDGKSGNVLYFSS